MVGGSESQAGIAGTGKTVSFDGHTVTPNPYFVGGIGTALGQVFRRDFPSESVYGGYFGTLRNRQAQADYAIDQLSFRQAQLTTRRDSNQVQVDVQNNVIALRQARARYRGRRAESRLCRSSSTTVNENGSSWEPPFPIT